jgi:Uma2 family endonuclease
MPMTPRPNVPSGRRWTVGELSTLSDDLRYELIDGEVVLLAPLPVQSELVISVTNALESECPDEYLAVHYLPLAVDQHSQLRPDAVVIRLNYVNESPVPVRDAVLVADVMSPAGHFRHSYAKATIYAAAGIPEYWIIDPWHDQRMVLTRLMLGPGGSYEIAESTDAVFHTDSPFPVTIDLPQLWKRRESLWKHARQAA